VLRPAFCASHQAVLRPWSLYLRDGPGLNRKVVMEDCGRRTRVDIPPQPIGEAGNIIQIFHIVLDRLLIAKGCPGNRVCENHTPR
jgi:hypothetical protein